jgi:putative heme-binding domain-containing protein
MPLLEGSGDSAPWKPVKTRGYVQDWTAKELEPLLDKVARGRNFESGRAAFNDTACILCHRLGNEGGSLGPELTSAASKYSRRDILEAILEPSKVISDQFQMVDIIKKDAEEVSGRITDDNGRRLLVQRPSLTATGVIEEVLISDIVRREPSKVSPMPAGLLNSLTQDEILDLLAYIEAMGNAKAKNFSP